MYHILCVTYYMILQSYYDFRILRSGVACSCVFLIPDGMVCLPILWKPLKRSWHGLPFSFFLCIFLLYLFSCLVFFTYR
jgi:hypothetical protein